MMAFWGGGEEGEGILEGDSWDSTRDGGPTTKITPKGEEAAEQNENWSRS